MYPTLIQITHHIIPNPKEAATIIKLGLGIANVTIAHPQHITTNKVIAMNSAKHARQKLCTDWASSNFSPIFTLIKQNRVIVSGR